MKLDEAKSILNKNGYLLENEENPYNLNDIDLKSLESRIYRYIDQAIFDVAKSLVKDLKLEDTEDNRFKAYTYVKHMFNKLMKE